MAAQRPWFRMTTMRPPAPAPAPAPPPAPAPARPPVIVLPAIPIRPPPPPAQPQEPPPPPAAASQPPTAPPPAAASQPPTAPPSPPAPAPPSSPAAPPPPASPMAAAPPAPQPSPPRASASAPPPPPRSPAAPPAPQKSPPRAPLAAPAPAPAAPPPPPPSSPVVKAAATTPQIKARSSPSPVPKPLSTANFKAATPVSSPKTTANPSSNRPPSPLQLPPAQIKPPSEEEEREPKIEQKSVLVQDDKPAKTNHNAHNYASKGKRGETPTKEKGPTKKLSDSEELGMRVITIAGDNRGALMEINSSSKKTHPPAKGYTLNQHGGEEGKSDDDKNKDLAAQSQPMATFLNSNVQGVNNSIVYHSSCHHNDPGIHLSLVRKVNGNNGGRGHHG